MDATDVHPWKVRRLLRALRPSLVTVVGRIMDLRDSHPAKTSSPSDVTVVGKDMDLSDLQK